MPIESRHSLRVALLALVLVLGAPAAVFAQAQPGDAAADPVPEAPAPDPSEAAVDLDTGTDVEDDDGEVIVVTGSAIRRKIADTPAPVAVLDRADIDAAGLASVGDILQNLPAQSNAINVQFNNGGDGSTRINLRGLGTNRTLVLVNGRRHVPGGTGADASVDLNSIPTAVIERVEVLKDGASAVYGSDAIGGVVNIITRSNFTGTEATGYIGSTGDGLGTIYDLSATAGHASDKGSIMFAAGYFEQFKMMAGDREFSRSDKAFDWETGTVSTRGSSATPQGTIIDTHDYDADGMIGNELWQQIIAEQGDAGVFYNDPSAGWRAFTFGGNSDVGEGDQYNYQPENYLVTPSTRYNVFSTGDYKFGKNVRGYFEASYTNRRSDQKLAPTPLFTGSEGIAVSADNFYNPFGRDFTNMRRRFVEANNRNFLQNIDTFRVVVGVEGQAPKQIGFLRENGWRWDLSYNYGRTEGTDLNEGRFVRSRVEAALGPSFMGADGTAQCGTPSNPVTGCVPLNLFGGEGTITQDMLDYISYTGTANGFTDQQSVLFNVNGKLFDTPWGGDVRTAIGLEYRDLSGGFEPDPLTASGDTTGNKGEPTFGSYDVREAYGEISAVPVVGRPGAQWIELTGAVRAFDYSTFGSDVTWKTGALWRPHKMAAVRGTFSTAFRAPSVGELFSGTADDFPAVTDPCDTREAPSPTEMANCAADGISPSHLDIRDQLRARIGGNPELEPETADIFTAGIVIEPPQIKGLAVTVDYFNIKIDQAIQPRGASVILSQCYSEEQRDQAACDAIIRDPVTNFITDIEDTESNIGGNETAGVDFNIRYDHSTPIGRFRHNFEGTWLQEYNEIQPDGSTLEGKGFYDLGAFPEWKANFSTIWGYKQLGAGVNFRFIGPFEECEDNDCNTELAEPEDGEEASAPSVRDIDPNVTADIFAKYSLKSSFGQSTLTMGVNNVSNTSPSNIFNGFLATSDAATYDFLGRFFYARLVQTF